MAKLTTTLDREARPRSSSSQPLVHGSARAYLIVIEGTSSSVFPLPAEGAVVMGRSPDAELRLADPAASRKHARMTIRDGELVLRDLGSHNGTWVNGEAISAPYLLSSGDIITISDAVLVLRREVDARTGPAIVDLPALRQRMDEEAERAARFGRPLSLLCVGFGRPATGEPQLLAALSRELRRIDVMAWGGPTQLLVLLPELELEEAQEVAQKLVAALGIAAPKVHVGAASFPTDGVDAETLLGAVRAAAQAAAVGQVMPAREGATGRRIGEQEVVVADPAMSRLYQLIERLAASDLPVLVCGETGTGKELAAAALHHWSRRKRKPLVTLNCAALPEALAESELFGHEKGAFSGATAAKVGLLESAHGGTAFLDEIGELSLAVQGKLLRVLETKRFMRLGEVRERSADVRVVAATNRDLDEEVRAGRFRKDLLFRLSAARVMLPPLRDRPREVPVLARTFLYNACDKAGRKPLTISDAAMQCLLAHRWPGNVRELRNLMDFMAASVAGPLLEPSHLKEGMIGAGNSASGIAPVAGPRAQSFRPIDEEVRELERMRMAAALEATGGNQTHAAELLSMPLRTFSSKVKQYDLLPGGSPLRRRERPGSE